MPFGGRAKNGQGDYTATERQRCGLASTTGEWSLSEGGLFVLGIPSARMVSDRPGDLTAMVGTDPTVFRRRPTGFIRRTTQDTERKVGVNGDRPLPTPSFRNATENARWLGDTEQTAEARDLAPIRRDDWAKIVCSGEVFIAGFWLRFQMRGSALPSRIRGSPIRTAQIGAGNR